jgi:hypothetical protein
MKKIKVLLMTVATVMTVQFANAQCTPRPSVPDSAGLDPNWQELPCIKRNTAYSETIYIQNFGQVSSSVSVEWLEVNELRNVPTGITGSFSYPAGNPIRRLMANETGCLEISGTTSDPAGDYKIGIVVCVKINLFANPLCGPADSLVGQLSALVPNLPNFDFYLRVIEANGTCPDTNLTGTSQSGGVTTVPTANAVGIQELKTVSSFNIYPNPITSNAVVSFVSSENGKYTAKMVDVMGKEVYTESVLINTGNNKFELNKGNLSAGVYLFTLSDGKSSLTRRVVIE